MYCCIRGCYSEFGEFRRATYICDITKLLVKWARGPDDIGTSTTGSRDWIRSIGPLKLGGKETDMESCRLGHFRNPSVS